MAAAVGDLVKEQPELLVEQVRPTIDAAVGADQRLHGPAVRLQMPQFAGHLSERAVAAEPEHGGVITRGPGEVGAEPVDDGVTGRVVVVQLTKPQIGLVRQPGRQRGLRVSDVGAAAVQPRHARVAVALDAGHERVHLPHGSL